MGRIALQDPETQEQVIVNTSRPEIRHAYAQRVRQAQESIGHLFRRNNVERIGVTTDSDYLPALRAYFRARKKY